MISALNELERFWFRVRLRERLLDANGSEYQTVLWRLMDLRFGDEFQRTAAWGRSGDKKNDGYHSPTRTLYACYAPDKLTEARTKGTSAAALTILTYFFERCDVFERDDQRAPAH